MRFGLASLVFLFAPALAGADPVAVTSMPLASFYNLSAATEFGVLSWRGGLSLASPSASFGGLSGLVLDHDCENLVAVSDAGRWFTAKLGYDAAGHLESLAGGNLSPIRDAQGRPFDSKPWSDAEAIAAAPNGQFLVGFESHERAGLYDFKTSGTAARFRLVKSPKAISEGPYNGELESISLLNAGRYEGYYMALAETNRDAAGNTRGWLWKGWKTIPFVIARFGDYNITDMAILPQGGVLILERSFSRTSLPGMAIRRFDSAEIKSGAVIAPELIFQGTVPFYAIDNMEGIAVCTRDGETRVTLVSDNNFNVTLQRTLLLQFVLCNTDRCRAPQ